MSSASSDLHDYVRAAARLLDLPLDDGQVERVSLHLGRTRAMVAALQSAPLHDELEPAEVYSLAPFPAEGT